LNLDFLWFIILCFERYRLIIFINANDCLVILDYYLIDRLFLIFMYINDFHCCLFLVSTNLNCNFIISILHQIYPLVLFNLFRKWIPSGIYYILHVVLINVTFHLSSFLHWFCNVVFCILLQISNFI